MHAIFVSSLSGAEIHAGRIGDLIAVDPAKVVGATPIEGESLDAIRLALGILPYAPGVIARRRAAQAEARRIAGIKTEAQRRILAIVPSWRQSNLLARTQQLTLAHGADPTQWPAEAQAELAANAALFARTLAIRQHSDAMEADPALAAAWPF